jgi:ubiquinone/menaquinone biosynthesis C-methylase UbiE
MIPVVSWLSQEELSEIYSSSYWNDLEKEKQKAWWIEDDQQKDRLIDYLRTSSLLDEFADAQSVILKTGQQNLVVADLAAGTGWASALLSKLDQVQAVHSVDISQHRIGSLFEHTCLALQANQWKINRYLGSFYSLELNDSSIDVVFLSQAFHHAHQPFLLLQEISRVLKQGGMALLIGEHHISSLKIIKRIFKTLLQEGRFTTNFYELFKPHPIMGDHYYRVSDYFFIAKSLGFNVLLSRLRSGNAMYILTKL